MALEKLAWYETVPFHLALLGTTLLLFLSAPVVGAVSMVRARLRPGRAVGQPGPARAARWMVAAVAGLSWSFLIATAITTSRLMASLGADPLALRALDLLVVLPPFIAVLAALSVVGLAPVWRKRYWRLPGRIHYTLLAGAAVAFTWFLAYWNLL